MKITKKTPLRPRGRTEEKRQSAKDEIRDAYSKGPQHEVQIIPASSFAEIVVLFTAQRYGIQQANTERSYGDAIRNTAKRTPAQVTQLMKKMSNKVARILFI